MTSVPELPPEALEIAQAVRNAHGRALLVGGLVRDHLLGRASKDVDMEIHGLELPAVEALLAQNGDVIAVGRAFGVFRLRGVDMDISLPRRDSKVGVGHRGFDVAVDPHLGMTEAARRRDLTINAIMQDPLTGEYIDPHGGRADLEQGLLRATDPVHFVEDPLRGVRVAQFLARLEMTVDPELLDLCRGLDLSELPGERMFTELQKLLLKGVRPSLGLAFLRESELLRFFPELLALVDVPQDARWHPEGDVWVHTRMVCDEAAALRDGGPDDEALMFGALCHDLGKPGTTTHEDGRIRSAGHSEEGVPLVRTFLERLRAPATLTDRVATLVLHHLAPGSLYNAKASMRAYRRLARKLGESGVTVALLEKVGRADHLGRTTEDALAKRYPGGDHLLAVARELQIEHNAPVDVVLGRDLIARGMQPGKEFGKILSRCREVQDETGWSDKDAILARVLGESDV